MSNQWIWIAISKMLIESKECQPWNLNCMEGNLSIFQKVDKIVQKGSNSEKSLLGFPLSEGKKIILLRRKAWYLK